MGPSVPFLVWAQTLTGTILCKKLVNRLTRWLKLYFRIIGIYDQHFIYLCRQKELSDTVF